MKCETFAELLELQQALMNMRDMMGWLCTRHRFEVNYPDNLEATKRVQAQLDDASAFIYVIYVFAVLDEAGFDGDNKWISSDDKKELKAWKHIRNTGAHAPGGRASGHRQAFDDFMYSSQSSRSGLKPNCVFTTTSISIQPSMGFNLFQFAQQLVDSAISRSASHGQTS